MATANKGMTQPAHGSDTNTWDVPVNANTGIIDTAFGGVTVISVTSVSGTVTLTSTQYIPPNIVFTGTLTANVNYQLPSGVGGFWSVYNNTSGTFSLTFSSAAGGPSISTTQGRRIFVIADGTNRGVIAADNTLIAGAADTQVQFNSGGFLSGSPNLTFDGTSLTANALISNTDATINDVRIGAGGGSISSNVRVGTSALGSNTTGSNNIAVGLSALSTNTTGSNNTVAGSTSGKALTSGGDNSFFGYNVAPLATTATKNVGIGSGALAALTTGAANVVNGYQAGAAITTGGSNIIEGYLSGSNVVTGTYNVIVGAFTPGPSSGSNNILLGANIFSLGNATTASDNVAIGTQAMVSATTCSSNVALGIGAMASVSSGSSNFALGAGSGNDSLLIITTQSHIGVLGTNATTAIYSKVALTVTSDARDKTNIEPLSCGLDVVKSVAPVSFQFKDRKTHEVKEGVRLGWLAQDFLKQNPTTPIIDHQDPENLKLHESMTVPILWRAVQELSAQVEELRKAVG